MQLKKLVSNLTRLLELAVDFEIKPPDLIVKSRNRVSIIRYLVGEEADFGLNESDDARLVKFVKAYANVLDRLPEGTEIKVVKFKVDLGKLLSRLGNEMMNIRASLDVVEEPHVKQRLLSKLRVIESLYRIILGGKSISRLIVVVKIHSSGNNVDTVKRTVSTLASMAKNVIRSELGIYIREADTSEISWIIRYELGIVDNPGAKQVVIDNERICALVSPIPKYKKPSVDLVNSIPIGIDLETGWPVLIPVENLTKHILVLGPTGRGKSTFLATLIEGITSLTGVKILGIDFKGDLVSMLEDSTVEIADPREYPINIVEKPEYFGVVDWGLALSDVLANVLGLKQETVVKIVSKVFSRKGMDTRSILLDKDLSVLSPAIELLTETPRYEDLMKLLNKDVIFNIGGYGTAFQNIYGGLLLHIFKKLIFTSGGSGEVSRVLVIDEAWRVRSLSILQELIKEGRSRGVGLVLATQNPSDLPREVIENIHLLMVFGSINEGYRREAQKMLSLPNSIASKLAYLDVGEAILINALDPHPVVVRIKAPEHLVEKVNRSIQKRF